MIDFNPKTVALKKFLIKLLDQKYLNYQDLADRLGHYLVTEKDIQLFARMISDIYELGYTKAVNDYKDQLVKFGIQVNINQKNLVDSP